MLVCGRCGHHNAEGTRFCASCDTYLDFSNTRKAERPASGQEPATPAAPPPPPPPQTPPPPPPQPTWQPGPPPAPAGPAPGGRPYGRRPPAREPEYFSDEDDYGTLMDDLAALGYGPGDLEAEASRGGQRWPAQQPPADQAGPPQPTWQAPPTQAYRPGPAEGVLPQAVQPGQQQRQAQTPPPEVAPDQAGGIVAVPPGERQQLSQAVRAGAEPTAQAVATGPRPGEVACPNCGRSNPPDRRFCRCGHQLAPSPRTATPSPRPAARQQAAVPWWRRWFGRAKTLQQGPTGNLRTQYNRALEVRTMFVRGMLLLGGLGLGVSMIGIGPLNARSFLTTQFGNLTQRFDAIDSRAVEVLPEQEPPEGFAPEFVTDRQLDRAWAVGWNAEVAVVDAPCSETEAAAGALSISFARPGRVDRVLVRAGLDRNNPEWARLAQPKVVDLRFSDGTCQRLDLQNTFDEQRFDLKIASAEGVTVTLVDAYPPADGPGEQTALTELTFQARR